jgi:hypothetical protein
LAETERYAEPALESQIDDEISALMISFRSARTISAAEADATVAAYIDILRGLPLWAIRRGFRKVKLGEVEGVSLDFPPAAPRLRKVVTDEMIPLKADRIEVARILSAREAPPENPEMRKRASEVIASGLNPMQQKYGKDYGLGGVLPAIEIFGSAPEPKPAFRPLQGEALVEYYRHHGLGGRVKQQSVSVDGQDTPFEDHAAAREARSARS